MVPGPIVLAVVSTRAPSVSDAKSFAFPTCAYHDSKTITLDATGGGFADILTITEEAVVEPEPGYTFITALGLLAVGAKLFRRASPVLR